MTTSAQTLIDLETRFWQSMVDQDPDIATSMLAEPALMVSSHGVIKFDHAGYRKMAEHGPSVLTSFELQDVQVEFPNDAVALITYKVTQGVAGRGEDGPLIQQMNDTSTWVQSEDGDWKCVMHTETPSAESDKPG